MKKSNNIPTNHGFKVPDNYFVSANNAIKDRLALEKILDNKANISGYDIPDAYFENNLATLKDRIALEEVLGDKNNKSVFEIPDSYFENNLAILKDRIALEEVLGDKNNKSGFEIPNSYFESNINILNERLSLEEKLNGQINQGFDVPSDYFEKLNDKIKIEILSKVSTDESKKEVSKPSGKVILLKKYFYPAIGLAASLLLLVGIFFDKDQPINTNNLELASITEYFDTHNTTFYENDLEDLLTEEDLVLLENDMALEDDDALIDYLEERVDSYEVDSYDLYIQ